MEQTSAFDSSESEQNLDPRTDLLSVAVGLVEMGARGLRAVLGYAVPGEALIDVALGAAVVGGESATRAAKSAGARFGPRVSGIFRVPKHAVFPGTWRRPPAVELLRQRGRQERLQDGATIGEVLDRLVPVIVEEVVRRVDVDALMKAHVDLDEVIAGLDLRAGHPASDLRPIRPAGWTQ